MAHSIELRVPFLDHRLVESMAALTPRRKIEPQINKPRLLDNIDDQVLHLAARQRKMGFTFPLARWLRENAGDLESLSLRGTHFEPKVVRRLWEDFRRGRLHWSRIWSLVVVEAARERRTHATDDLHEGVTLLRAGSAN
jgi:asparagine synthase (glutamine-hydrolysing)